MTTENLYPALQKAPERPRRPYGRITLIIGALLFSAYFGLKAAPGSLLRDGRQKPASVSKQASSDSLALARDSKASLAKSKVRFTKNIEDIVPGEYVMAWDERTGKLEPKEVLK